MLTKSMRSNVDLPENSDTCKFLCTLREFSQIPPNEIRIMAESSRFCNLSSGQYLTTEGTERSLYGFVVVTGCLSMLKTSINGKELIVEILQAGDVLGLLQMLAADRIPNQLTARAMQKSTVLLVPVKNFVRLITSYPILSRKLITHLLLCLNSSYNLSRGLAHDRVEVRIAAVLASLALKFSNTSDLAGIRTVNFTRQQLADLTGTTSETAIRVTRTMQQEGLIDIKHPGIIRILKLKDLQYLAEE